MLDLARTQGSTMSEFLRYLTAQGQSTQETATISKKMDKNGRGFPGEENSWKFHDAVAHRLNAHMVSKGYKDPGLIGEDHAKWYDPDTVAKKGNPEKFDKVVKVALGPHTYHMYDVAARMPAALYHRLNLGPRKVGGIDVSDTHKDDIKNEKHRG